MQACALTHTCTHTHTHTHATILILEHTDCMLLSPLIHRLQELSGEHDPRIQPPAVEPAPVIEHYQAQPPPPSGTTIDCHSPFIFKWKST